MAALAGPHPEERALAHAEAVGRGRRCRPQGVLLSVRVLRPGCGDRRVLRPERGRRCRRSRRGHRAARRLHLLAAADQGRRRGGKRVLVMIQHHLCVGFD